LTTLTPTSSECRDIIPVKRVTDNSLVDFHSITNRFFKTQLLLKEFNPNRTWRLYTPTVELLQALNHYKQKRRP